MNKIKNIDISIRQPIPRGFAHPDFYVPRLDPPDRQPVPLRRSMLLCMFDTDYERTVYAECHPVNVR